MKRKSKLDIFFFACLKNGGFLCPSPLFLCVFLMSYLVAELFGGFVLLAKMSHRNVAKQGSFSIWNCFRSWINNSSSGMCFSMCYCISYSLCCTFSASSIGNKPPCLSPSGQTMEVLRLVSYTFSFIKCQVMWMKGRRDEEQFGIDGSKYVNVG